MHNFCSEFDATGEEYANIDFIMNLMAMVGLLFIMPILTRQLKLHESLVTAGITALYVCFIFSLNYEWDNCKLVFRSCAGLVIAGLGNDLWVFAVGYWMTFLSPSMFGIGRSLITKCVIPSEYGKVRSG